MCGRYTLASTTPAQLRARFPLGESVAIAQRFNVAPGDEVLSVVMREGGPTGALLRWGLVPPWAEDPKVGFRMINARAETVADKPAYRGPFLGGRCLIVADGFYEWQRDGAARQPFHITRGVGEPFAFAGLRTAWRDPSDPDGELLRSCTIVTTAANPVVAHIHPRMPVILDPADEEEWLDPGTPPQRLHAMLHALPDEQTHARAVSKAVNDARYDGPECLAPPEPEPAPPQGELF
ncbi:MAG TPA: SOS response-associated peptidase [Conexibacter sp.]|jgi:putative SOS response-associated peptidase YedK|nr:SOS response-associated peptidase [Conexibacter sp.]